MTQSADSYSKLDNKQKKEILEKLYIKEKLSFADIANKYNTYANKIRRDAISFKIPIRDKAQAQKNALQSGKHKHPTKGQQRAQDTKDKIGMSVMKAWDDLDTKTLKQRKEKSKLAWEKMDDDTKKNLVKLANEAVRQTSKVGSKLEKFLLNRLLNDGYRIDFHKEQTLTTTKLQIDLFIPKINTAIEVDGPSHFLPVWGEDALKRNMTYDNKKQGLILGKGWVLIRIKQKKDFSKSRANILYDKLLNILKEIEINFPKPDDRTFTIED